MSDSIVETAVIMRSKIKARKKGSRDIFKRKKSQARKTIRKKNLSMVTGNCTQETNRCRFRLTNKETFYI